MVYFNDAFPEKANGDFDFTQTGGEFPSYWFAENKYYNDISLTPFYGVVKNGVRFVFISFKEAIEFLQNYYIDPILEDRMIRRSHFVNDAFILASSYDTLEDDDFDYYIYDKDLQNQYIEYLFGEDPFIEKIRFQCSIRKIKVQKKCIRHYIRDKEEREFYPIDDNGCHYKEEYVDAYPERDVYYKQIYAFKLKDFLNSGINNYNDFKEKELELRKKELELFKKIKEEKDLEEARELKALKEKQRKEKEQKENDRKGEWVPPILFRPDPLYYYKIYIKEVDKLKWIYQEIKKYNLRISLGNEEDFIDKMIEKTYKDNYRNERVKNMKKNNELWSERYKKQYHITFHVSYYAMLELFYIVKANSREEAIAQVEEDAQAKIFEEYGEEVEYEINIEYFHLATYPLTDFSVESLISSKPKEIDGDTLGRLIVWFNDRNLDFIISFFNNDKSKLSDLERCLCPCEIKIDLEKLELLRKFISEQ